MRTFFTIAALGLCLSPLAQAATPSCTQEIQRGVASWYGPGFNGAKTKSEEVFNAAALSAAHRSLPFGTMVRVVNMRNHKSVTVRINDRGAFGRERVIDVSKAAAKKLDMVKDGTAPVTIYKCRK